MTSLYVTGPTGRRSSSLVSSCPGDNGVPGHCILNGAHDHIREGSDKMKEYRHKVRKAPTTSTRATTIIPLFHHDLGGTFDAQKLHTLSSSTSDDDDHDNREPMIFYSFQVLGLSRQFLVSPETIKQSYCQLMTQYHPDKQHAHNNTTGNNDATLLLQDVEQKASQVTHTYQLLKDPHTRASHLLELLNHPVDKMSQNGFVGMEFLMQIMEWREIVDNANDNDVLQEIWKETQDHIQIVLQALETVFDKEDYTTALRLSTQLQYWHRLKTAIQEKREVE
jgi:Fe-S protein assembly co-chaperone HscB